MVINRKFQIEGKVKEEEKSKTLPTFRFRLQTVLEVRTEEVDRLRQHVAGQEKVLNDIRQSIQWIQGNIQQSIQEYNQRLEETGHLDPSLSRGLSGYLGNCRKQTAAYRELQLKQEEVLRGIREELRQAVIRQRSLELLKEKDLAKFRKKQEQAEELALSEMTSQRWHLGSPLQ